MCQLSEHTSYYTVVSVSVVHLVTRRFEANNSFIPLSSMPSDHGVLLTAKAVKRTFDNNTLIHPIPFNPPVNFNHEQSMTINLPENIISYNQVLYNVLVFCDLAGRKQNCESNLRNKIQPVVKINLQFPFYPLITHSNCVPN